MKSSSPQSKSKEINPVSLQSFRKELNSLSDPVKAKTLRRFFKTGPGEYAEGDQFLGVTVPKTRQLIKKYHELSLFDLKSLIQSKIHEERLASLLILVHQYQNGDDSIRKEIFDFYLANTTHINNWDLVDSSAEHIVGSYLQPLDKSLLAKLARSENLWERRIAMLSTFRYIKRGEAAEALKVAEFLVKDKHDLIHKAVGWMLREVGKRCSVRQEEAFLMKHYRTMPRTMLRYAIERFPKTRRIFFLKNSS